MKKEGRTHLEGDRAPPEMDSCLLGLSTWCEKPSIFEHRPDVSYINLPEKTLKEG